MCFDIKFSRLYFHSFLHQFTFPFVFLSLPSTTAGVIETFLIDFSCFNLFATDRDAIDKIYSFFMGNLREFRNIANSAKFFPPTTFSSYPSFMYIFTFEKLLTTEFFCWIDKNLCMNLCVALWRFFHLWWGLANTESRNSATSLISLQSTLCHQTALFLIKWQIWHLRTDTPFDAIYLIFHSFK